MFECLIEGCPNESKLIAKSGGKSYYACKEHKQDVAQIVAKEHSKGELERIEHIIYAEKRHSYSI